MGYETRTADSEVRMTAQRARLPNRRESRIQTLGVGGQEFTACVGLDPVTCRPRELFLSGGKEGSQFDAMLADAAVVISVALQHGVPAGALAKSTARIPLGPVTPAGLDTPAPKSQPASPVGAALDLLCEVEADNRE